MVNMRTFSLTLLLSFTLQAEPTIPAQPIHISVNFTPQNSMQDTKQQIEANQVAAQKKIEEQNQKEKFLETHKAFFSHVLYIAWLVTRITGCF